MEIGKFKDVLKGLPTDFVNERKNDLVGIQSNLGGQIRSKATGKKSGIMSDTIQRMRNILNMGYIPEKQKSTRTRYIDRQKAIGEVIRSSRRSSFSQAAHNVYSKLVKKSGGRSR